MSRKLSFCVVLAATTFLLPARAYSYGYLDSFDGGTPQSGAGAYSAALGGAVSTHDQDAFSLFLNPAGMSYLDGWTASAGAGALSWKETHRYGIDRKLRSESALGMRCVAGTMPLGGVLTVGAGLAAVADADYAGTRYCIDDLTGESYAQEILYASGVQWDAVAGVSCGPFDGYSAGFSAGLRTGTISLDYVRYDYFSGLVDSVLYLDTEVSELAFRAGLMKETDIATLGVSYSAGGECLDPVLTGGFRFRAPHLQNTRVGFEADLSSPLARNDYAGRLMIEFPITQKTTILSGVSFSDYPSECGSGMGFSLGADQRLGVFDVSAAVHWRTSQIYGRYIQNEDSDRIDESTTELIMGVSVNP